ncbi:hypothetical protein AVEN_117245-1 [Araneus ventricosus]|uniref:Uncharacterized protein n=1 Tax=Araneus ventricosus TaxID=182803 RepID=A0A4Y2AWS3_ARAVE|nr:hypothetical protein AVEN_117245-1 [Araneus ventricosus]
MRTHSVDIAHLILIRGANIKKAELLGSSFHHKKNLPVAVVEAMRPLFRDLSHADLLKKCLHGSTQNPNESVNNVNWTRITKKTFVHIEALSLLTYDARSTFNIRNVTLSLEITQFRL